MNHDFWSVVGQNMTWAHVPGYVGGAFVIASFFMRTMIPLRGLGMASNVCFILYSYLMAQYPTMFLHAFLLPLNFFRMRQMAKLVQRVQSATEGDQTLEWLKPYMKRRMCREGEVLFRKGERADQLFYIVSGLFRVPEIGVTVRPGQFTGELGLLAPDGLRTGTLDCVNGGELLAITYESVKELYFQNPDFGFYFLQLATGRLFENMQALEARVAALTVELEAIKATSPPAHPATGTVQIG